MSEYIVELDSKHSIALKLALAEEMRGGDFMRGEIVRCRDCKHATISSLGYVKYCEKFVLPDEDGYGADPQVMLPLDFFCGYGELRGDTE